MGLSDLLNVTQIYELVKKGAMLEAQEAILKYREEIVKLTEENIELKQEISDLTNQINLEHELKYVGEVYYRLLDDNLKEGPFCPRCYDVDRKLVRLQALSSTVTSKYGCYQCHNSYRV